MKILQLFTLICLLNVPLYGSILVLNGLTHVHSVGKGKTITGKIQIKNSSSKESRVVIYKQDLMSDCARSISYEDVNSHSFSLANWLKTNVDEKLLAPNEEYELRYTIAIPDTQVQQGTYWSVLMVEGADPVKEETDNGLKVNSKVRYAIQVLADVGAYESPKMTFENVEYKKSDSDNKTISVLIKNAGQYSAKVSISLEVYNAKGEKIKTLEGLAKRIYPNNCNIFSIDVDKLPKGKYEGILVADNGKDLFGSNISLDIE